MKKFYSIFTCVAIVLLLSGCCCKKTKKTNQVEHRMPKQKNKTNCRSCKNHMSKNDYSMNEEDLDDEDEDDEVNPHHAYINLEPDHDIIIL